MALYTIHAISVKTVEHLAALEMSFKLSCEEEGQLPDSTQMLAVFRVRKEKRRTSSVPVFSVSCILDA
jgi:hypothetical protein